MVSIHPEGSWDPRSFLITESGIHVWFAQLELPDDALSRLRSLLSGDEIERACRLRFPHARRRFIASRGILRDLLGRYLGIEPVGLRFVYNHHGKPALDGALVQGLSFNVAHAGNVAFYGIASGRLIGIDVERLRTDLPLNLAEHFFSERERQSLRSVPASLRTVAFFNCWTRKEAYIKARGLGLSLPLRDFDVTLKPGEPVALLEVRGDSAGSGVWSLRALPAPLGYVAALAVEGVDVRLRVREWSP